jgi:hypothetical protein
LRSVGWLFHFFVIDVFTVFEAFTFFLGFGIPVHVHIRIGIIVHPVVPELRSRPGTKEKPANLVKEVQNDTENNQKFHHLFLVYKLKIKGIGSGRIYNYPLRNKVSHFTRVQPGGIRI